MNKRLILSVGTIAALAAFTSCSWAVKPFNTNNKSDASSASASVSVEATEPDTSTEVSVTSECVYEHTFNPHCLSRIYVEKYGREFEENYYRYCDAVLSGAETVKCDKKEWLPVFRDISWSCLPIAYRYCYFFDDDIVELSDGEYKLSYALPKDEFLKKVEEFKSRIGFLIETACREGDTPFEMTLALYRSECERITYDDAGAEENDLSAESLSPYRTLMTDTGVCQEIAGAYAYLLMQVGVDAVTCGGITKDGAVAHEWTVVKICDNYYHCDLTFQLSDRASLKYFGMDDSQRETEGDWDMQYNSFGMTNDIWYNDLKLEDRRFEPLWTITSYKIDRENNKLCCYDSPECTGDPVVEISLAG